MAGQPQVVIAAKVQKAFAVYLNVCILRSFERQTLAIPLEMSSFFEIFFKKGVERIQLIYGLVKLYRCRRLLSENKLVFQFIFMYFVLFRLDA